MTPWLCNHTRPKASTAVLEQFALIFKKSHFILVGELCHDHPKSLVTGHINKIKFLLLYYTKVLLIRVRSRGLLCVIKKSSTPGHTKTESLISPNNLNPFPCANDVQNPFSSSTFDASCIMNDRQTNMSHVEPAQLYSITYVVNGMLPPQYTNTGAFKFRPRR